LSEGTASPHRPLVRAVAESVGSLFTFSGGDGVAGNDEEVHVNLGNWNDLF